MNSASPIKTGEDLFGRLRKDPKSVPIGVAGAVGGLQYIPAALLTKAIGGNFRDLKVVGFKGSAESLTNLLGGHVDLVPTAGGNAAPHVATGKLRVVGVAAPKRFGGTLAHAPTWKEQGVDVVWSSWRCEAPNRRCIRGGMLLPRNLPAPAGTQRPLLPPGRRVGDEGGDAGFQGASLDARIMASPPARIRSTHTNHGDPIMPGSLNGKVALITGQVLHVNGGQYLN